MMLKPGWLLFLLLLLAAYPVGAQENVTATSEVRYTFGQAMHFTLRAESAVAITDVQLYVTAPELENSWAISVAAEPGRNVELSQTLSMHQVGFAPFTVVTYWWALHLENGEQVVLPEETVEYLDDRFTWQTMVGEDVTVRWTGRDETLARAALEAVGAARPRLDAFFPAESARPLRITIYPTTADLRSALRLTGRDGDGAHLSPQVGSILVTAVNPRTAALDLGRRVPHEMAHLRLKAVAGPAYENIPEWFDEGLASWFEAVPDPGYDLLLEQALAAGETLSLAELCRPFPAEGERLTLARAQSASLVRHVAERHGEEALTALMWTFAGGADCDEALPRALNRSPRALEQEWRRSHQPRSPLADLWQESGIWLLVLAGGFLVMALLIFPVGRGR